MSAPRPPKTSDSSDSSSDSDSSDSSDSTSTSDEETSSVKPITKTLSLPGATTTTSTAPKVPTPNTPTMATKTAPVPGSPKVFASPGLRGQTQTQNQTQNQTPAQARGFAPASPSAFGTQRKIQPSVPKSPAMSPLAPGSSATLPPQSPAQDFKPRQKKKNQPEEERILPTMLVFEPVASRRVVNENVGPVKVNPHKTLKGHTSGVYVLATQPEEDLIASGSDDGAIRVWDLTKFDCKFVLQGHTSNILCLEMKGKKLASGSNDNTCRIWDLGTGAAETVLRGHTHSIVCLTFEQTGRELITGSYDKTVKVWEISSGRCLYTLSGHTAEIECLQISSGLWNTPANVSSSQASPSLSSSTPVSPSPKSNPPSPTLQNTTTGTPGGFQTRQPAATIYGGSRASLFGSGSKALSSYASTSTLGTADPGQSSTRILSGSGDGTIRIWAMNAGNSLRTLTGHQGTVWSMKILRNNLLASGSEDATIRIWDYVVGRCLRVLTGHTDSIMSLDYCKEFLVSASDDWTLRVWDYITGKPVYTLFGHTAEVESLVLLEDPKDSSAPKTETNTTPAANNPGSPLSKPSGNTNPSASNPSPLLSSRSGPSEGFRIVSGSFDKTIRIWDSKTGKCTHLMATHLDEVVDVKYHLHGSQIISASEDSSLMVWKIPEL